MNTYVVAGHFGSSLSYATIAKRVAEMLRERGRLAGTMNFDDRYEGFASVGATKESMRSARILCITTPGHHAEQLAEWMGFENSILFLSPNTDELDEQAVRVSTAFGGIVVPSRYCEYTVLRSTGRVSVRVPLGVSESFARASSSLIRSRAERIEAKEPIKVLHMSTDGFLPGRKGTEPLIQAISICRDRLPQGIRFTFHVLPSIRLQVRALALEYDVSDLIDIVSAGERGMSDGQLLELISKHDLIVQPSRSEGFGMTQLMSLVSGVPLVTTFATGTSDFLDDFRGCWRPIRHTALGPIAGEQGMAPYSDPGEIADILFIACQESERKSMLNAQRRNTSRFIWTWEFNVQNWIAAMHDSIEMSE